MRRYTVVIERDPSGKWTLTAPALPGYVACGDNEEEVLELAREGIPFHLACLVEEGTEPEGVQFRGNAMRRKAFDADAALCAGTMLRGRKPPEAYLCAELNSFPQWPVC